MRRNSVFWAFCSTFRKKREKRVFFSRFLEILCKKFAKNANNTAFFELLARHSAKRVRKQRFFTFFETLCTKFAKNAKKSVFRAFSATFRNKCEKTVHVFHVFRDTLYKVRKKTAFFVRRSAKSVRKQCFFHVFRDTLYKIRKKAIKQRILSFLRDVSQKVWENSVFSHFSRYFVQSLQKIRKTEFIELFAGRSAKNVRKQCFLAFFGTLCTKIAMYAKNSVFELFVWGLAKSVCFSHFSFFSHFSVFFTFFETLCTKIAYYAKTEFFAIFSYSMFCKKREKTVFFHVIRDTSYEVRKMCEKKQLFLSFLREVL